MDKLLLNMNEAAALLGISRSQMARLIYTGNVASLKIGALRRVPVAALHRYINEHQGNVA